MTMFGADSDQLDELALRMKTAATMLDNTRRTISSQLASSPWEGPKAAKFRSDWNRSHRVALANSVVELQRAGDVLRQNAYQQRAASAAMSLRDLGRIALHAGRWAVRRVNNAEAEALRLLPELRRMQSASVAEQAAWWATLTSAERAALLAHSPGRLTGLSGLPPEVLAQARLNFIAQRSGEIAVGSTKELVGGSVTVPIYAVNAHVGVDASTRTTTFADGHVEVALTLRGELGASVGKDLGSGATGQAGRTAGGEITMNYSFASQAEADKFLQGLKDEMIPTRREVVRHFANMSLIAADAAHDVTNYLGGYSGSYESTTFTGDLTTAIDVKAGPVSFQVQGGAHVSYDTKAGMQMGMELSGNVAADLGIIGGGASASVGLDVQVGSNGQLTGLTIRGEASASGSGSLDSFLQSAGGPVALDASVGGQATFEAKLDLTDPHIQAQAGLLVKAAATGDPAASGALMALIRESDLTVTLDQSSSQKGGFDGGVAEVHYEKSTTQNVITIMKPPGGGWITYQPGVN